MFYGILIYLYAYDNREHKLPHIHIEYQDYEAVVSIVDSKILTGDFPSK